MNNSITVQINTSFKGEVYHYQATIPLKAHLGEIVDLLPILARKVAQANGVDTYSYLFDAMESADIEVVAAEGFVARFLQEGPIPIEAFVQACLAVTTESLLQDIAQRYFPGVQADTPLQAALLEAFELGRQAQ